MDQTLQQLGELLLGSVPTVILLALLYLHPEAEYSLTEAASAIGASLNAVHYEAGKLSESGLVTTRKRGNLRLVRAVTDSLLSRPLKSEG